MLQKYSFICFQSLILLMGSRREVRAPNLDLYDALTTSGSYLSNSFEHYRNLMKTDNVPERLRLAFLTMLLLRFVIIRTLIHVRSYMSNTPRYLNISTFISGTLLTLVVSRLVCCNVEIPRYIPEGPS